MPTRRRLLVCLAMGAAAMSLFCAAAQAQSNARPRERKAPWNAAPENDVQYADAEGGAEEGDLRHEESYSDQSYTTSSFAEKRVRENAASREADAISPSRNSRRNSDNDAQQASFVEETDAVAAKRATSNESAAASVQPVRDLPTQSSKSPLKSLPLATKRLPSLGESAKGEQPAGWSALVSVGGSLTIVLGIFLVVVWFLRRTSPKSSAILPNEVFEVLGRAPLAGRQTAQLVRCGAKLLLISVTPGGSETLTEITDAVEVDRLAGLCQQSRGTSASTTFRNLFSQFGNEPAVAKSKPTTPARGLFARHDSRLSASDSLLDDFAADRALSNSRREVRDA